MLGTFANNFEKYDGNAEYRIKGKTKYEKLIYSASYCETRGPVALEI